MTFNTPASEEEMLSTLAEIYKYYRLKAPVWDNVSLVPLHFDRLVFKELTSEQLTEKARTSLYHEYLKELLDIKDGYAVKINSAKAEIVSLKQSLNEKIEQINSDFKTSEEQVVKEANKRGLAKSGITLNGLAQAENEKNELINKTENQTQNKINALNSQISAWENTVSGLEEKYAEVFENKVKSKAQDLQDEQDKIKREVFTYNNTLEEKEQKSENSVRQAKANLELKYIEINYSSYSKEQLVEMGYYKDVIKCVTDYYDSLEATAAYRQILDESKLVLYLEDYYPDIVYLYRTKAGY